jgi:AraC-like DNA-binding protein
MVDHSWYLRKKVSIPAACRERYVPLGHDALAGWRDAGIGFSGVSDLVPGYAISNPRPVQIMVIATIAGRGTLITPGGELRLEPGTLLVAPPGLPVGWSIDGSAWSLAWWYLEPRPRWQAWLGDQPLLVPCPQGSLLAALLLDLIDRCARHAEDDGVLRATADLALRHLIALADPRQRIGDQVEQRFAALWAEVHTQPHLDWSLDRIARQLGISVSTAQRVARQQLGKPAHHALVDVRLSRARDLLHRTAYPIGAIADLVGYADAFTFSSAYRRWAGHPPSAERAG